MVGRVTRVLGETILQHLSVVAESSPQGDLQAEVPPMPQQGVTPLLPGKAKARRRRRRRIFEGVVLEKCRSSPLELWDVTIWITAALLWKS